jgi:hypothetical protein
VLGAAAIMSNGTVQGRCGTAAVAMAAHKRNVPVLFTCETYKLCDKVRNAATLPSAQRQFFFSIATASYLPPSLFLCLSLSLFKN